MLKGAINSKTKANVVTSECD